MDIVDIICKATPLDTRRLFPLGLFVYRPGIRKVLETIHYRRIPRKRMLYYKIMKGVFMSKHANLNPLLKKIREGTVTLDDIDCIDDPDQVFLTLFGRALLKGIPLNPLVTPELVEQLIELYNVVYFEGKLFDTIERPIGCILNDNRAGKANIDKVCLHYNLFSLGFKKGDIFVVADLRRAHSPLEAMLRVLVHEMTHVLLRYKHESYNNRNHENYTSSYYVNDHHTALFMVLLRRCYGSRDCVHRLKKQNKRTLLNVHYTDNWKYIRRRDDNKVLFIKKRHYDTNKITTRDPLNSAVRTLKVTRYYNEYIRNLEIEAESDSSDTDSDS